MKTISIPAQVSAVALAQAFADALAAEIGWTSDENGNVKKDGISVYFKFTVSSTRVTATVSNGYKDSDGGANLTFAAAKTYSLYLLETAGGSIAVGITESANTPILGTLIVKNAAGAYVGITFNGASIYTLRGIESATRGMALSQNANNGVSTSIVRMPDIWGGAMFTDLYHVVSCPYRSTDCVFFIGGKIFRSVGVSSSYMYFALPEE